ncbi:MAG: Crp/Fnr family transcriptional regulator [bacterium]
MPAPSSAQKRLIKAPPLNAGRLCECEFFSEFSGPARREILALSSTRTLSAGEILFEEGQACRALHLLLDGEVKMNKLSAEGKEQIIRRLHPGQIFGAAPLFTAQGTYPATAIALRASSVLYVPKAALIGFLKKEPDRFLRVLAFVSQHLQDMMRLAEAASLDKVPKRLADHLLALSREQGGPRVGQHLRLEQSQSELAADLGTVREVIGRALRGLQKRGLILMSGRGVVLKDPDALGRI